MWNLFRNQKISNQEKYRLLLDFDKVFGLKLERENYRKKREWKKADEIRMKIKEMGYWIEDTKEGPKIKKCPI
jgi:cysteinyl-tRNA synthetase